MTTLDKSLVKTYAQSSILPHKSYLELLELQVIFYRNQYGLSLIDIFLKVHVTVNEIQQMMLRRPFTGPE